MHRYVIAQLKPPRLFNLYPTQALAEADLERAIESSGKYDTIMTMDAYIEHERTIILSDPLVEINEEKFIEMLEVLPPLRWQQFAGWERFCMAEFWTGSYTQQYVRAGKRYFTRMVDVTDPKGWITLEECQKFIA